MKAEDIRIGMILIHRDKGEITVRGISPHCRDYKIDTDESWVYLKNCKVVKDSLTTQTVEERFTVIPREEVAEANARIKKGMKEAKNKQRKRNEKPPQTVEEVKCPDCDGTGSYKKDIYEELRVNGF